LPQHVNHINLLSSVGNSSKQMQQMSGSSVSNRPDGDESAVDEVAVDEVAVDEDEVSVVVVSFLLMVCSNCDRSFCLIERSLVMFNGGTMWRLDWLGLVLVQRHCLVVPRLKGSCGNKIILTGHISGKRHMSRKKWNW
jgi:hypothetical protein